MNIRAYLITKKIDPDLFKTNEPDRYKQFNSLFSQMHPNSFTAQKLFLINKLRNRYYLKKEPEEQVTKQVQKVKPKMVPKIKK